MKIFDDNIGKFNGNIFDDVQGEGMKNKKSKKMR